ncbi:MAG: response regulator transcription factor [Bryobacterales bacterium]|nr:response regulator transcription factor [Bryobacterales bacterium]
MSKKILVVEDDRDLCELLDYNLSRSGYQVQLAGRVADARASLEASKPDLIVLDVMLPDGDGFDFCRELRAEYGLRGVPILFLTARSQEIDKVLGLEIGGDDYITKPFSPRELLARVKAHLRRGTPPPAASESSAKQAGPLTIDQASHMVTLRGEPVILTATEYKLLEFFFASPGRVFSREQLLRAIWGDSTHVTPRNVDVHIRRLRERIEDEPENPKWIRTVRGFGYRFDTPE